MKKNRIPTILILLLICSILTGCSAIRTLDAAEDHIDHTLDAVEDRIERAPSPAPNQITRTEAAEIALEHAGFTADAVQYLHAEYEIDNGIPQYDVSFYADHREYDYEIHADTGEILSFERND